MKRTATGLVVQNVGQQTRKGETGTSLIVSSKKGLHFHGWVTNCVHCEVLGGSKRVTTPLLKTFNTPEAEGTSEYGAEKDILALEQRFPTLFPLRTP